MIATMQTYSKDQLPAEYSTWPKYRKKTLTSAIKIAGPFRVITSETENEPFLCQDGYLAIDARGYPYAIATEEFIKIYEEA
jgi:hypothetical protein